MAASPQVYLQDFDDDDVLYDDMNNITSFVSTGTVFSLKPKHSVNPPQVSIETTTPYNQVQGTTAPRNFGPVLRGGAEQPNVPQQKPPSVGGHMKDPTTKVPLEPPSGKKYIDDDIFDPLPSTHSKEADKADTVQDEDDEWNICWLSPCNFAICVFFLVLCILIILLASSGGGRLRASATSKPTQAPSQSPSLSPTMLPTTPIPTISPTSSPTDNPTSSPTTTFSLISTVCLGTTHEARTSICVNDHQWVRCEKNGSVKPQDNGNFLRDCERGDICPCTSLHRIGISDPCVLISDASQSELTCTEDTII